MLTQTKAAGVSVEALESLATLHQLTVEAGDSENLRQLAFRIVNRTIGYCRYDRAVLWDLRGRRPRLLGISGQTDLNDRAPLVAWWRQLVTALKHPRDHALLTKLSFAEAAELWELLTRQTQGLSAAWLPIVVDGHLVAGLWLERWSGRRFAPAEMKRLEALTRAYRVAWRSVASRGAPLLRRLLLRKWLVAAAVLVGLVAALVLVPVPLRIVAPCEVVPADPLAITAPLNGVIDEVCVLPGRPVARGALLATYDQRVAREELKIAQQQVQIIQSDLQRARVQAFDKPAAREQIALLENRLAQEQTRLRIAEHRASKLEIHAPRAGTVMLDDPQAWRGRPVQVGERLMLLVDPEQTKVRIWLPAHDNVSFDTERALKVILDSDPRRGRAAHLRFVASHSEVNGQGLAAFRAEAAWDQPQRDLKPGLEGTAVLYGDDVSLGYWLFRRPLAAVRRYFGV